MAFALDGGSHQHRCRHRPKKGVVGGEGSLHSGRGGELTVFPAEKTAVLILFGPLLT